MTFRITCVCLGNICRSPMAEAVLRDRFAAAGLADRVTVDSAGTAGYHVGEDADPRALACLTGAGYSLDHSARQFDPEWLESADLVLAMDAANLSDLHRLARRRNVPTGHVRLLRSFDPGAEPDAAVPDPYYGGAEGFADVLTQLERAAEGVVTHVRPRVAT